MTRPEDVLAVLEAIDRGEVTVTLTNADADGLFPEDPEYHASNGWDFRIFDDCGGWDYVDAFRPPSGEWVEVEGSAMEPILFWRPQDERKTWGWGEGGVSPTGYLV